MTTLQNDISLSYYPKVVSTVSTNDSLLASHARMNLEEEKWLKIFETLHVWCESTSLLDYEEIEPPSCEIVIFVLQKGKELMQAGFAGPDRVIPDGEGGIVLKWRLDTNLTVLNFEVDGGIERIVFQNNKIVERHILKK